MPQGSPQAQEVEEATETPVDAEKAPTGLTEAPEGVSDDVEAAKTAKKRYLAAAIAARRL